MVQYPNIDLGHGGAYRPLPERTDTDRLSAALEGTLDVDELATLFRQAVENAVVGAYSVLGEDSDHPAAQDALGVAKVLEGHYWSGHYYAARSEACGRDRARLVALLDRLDDLRSGAAPDAHREPLFPVDGSASATGRDVVDRFDELERAVPDPSEAADAAERNLAFASDLLAVLHSSSDGATPSSRDGARRVRWAAFTRTCTLEPAAALELLSGIEEPADDAGPAPRAAAIRARAHALCDDAREAGESLAADPAVARGDEGELQHRCLQLYRWAGDGEAVNALVRRAYDEHRRRYFFDDPMTMEIPSRRMQAVKRIAELRGVPPILVSAVPKSGTTFLTNEIHHRLRVAKMKFLTEVPVAEVRTVPPALEEFARGGAVCRQFFPPDEGLLATLADSGVDRVLFHLRDPRRVLVSWVFYREAKFRKPGADARVVGASPAEYAELDFGEKVRHQFEHFLRPYLDVMADWIALRDREDSAVAVRITRFEDLVADPDAFFGDVFDFFGVDVTRPTRRIADPLMPDRSEQTDKKRGGDVDEWTEYVPPEVRREVVAAVPPSVRSLYPDVDWEAEGAA